MTTTSLSLYTASQSLQDRLEWALSALCAPGYLKGSNTPLNCSDRSRSSVSELHV